MKVGYTKGYTVTLFVIGVVAILLGLGVSVWWLAGMGLAFLGFGAMSLRRAAFLYDPESNTLTFLAIIGPGKRQFGGAKGEQLLFDGDTLFAVKANGKRRKLKLARLGLRKDQAAQVADAIRAPAGAESASPADN